MNGVTQLMMMKADVLSGFESIDICTAYKHKGKEITHLPFDIAPEFVEPIYKSFKGWNEDLTGMTTEDELPIHLMDYIAFIEKEMEIPITIISVGPDRKQTIFR